ncbi:uncharacterized protein TNCV_1233231 [Trichonephila clavipes]|nr:uncharacterized protein TNCV_1233231 [Trichonephila clavipes]
MSSYGNKFHSSRNSVSGPGFLGFYLQLPFQGHPVAAVAKWPRYRIVAGLVTSPVPLNGRIGERCTLSLSRAQMSYWCGVVVRRGVASSGVVHVPLPWFVAKSPSVAELTHPRAS